MLKCINYTNTGRREPGEKEGMEGKNNHHHTNLTILTQAKNIK